MSELAQQFDVRTNQIACWKLQYLENANTVFDGNPRDEELPVEVNWLHAKISELTLENGYSESVLSKAGLLSTKR